MWCFYDDYGFDSSTWLYYTSTLGGRALCACFYVHGNYYEEMAWTVAQGLNTITQISFVMREEREVTVELRRGV